MNDEYLWDRTGEPDDDVTQLEKVLGTLRWSGRKQKHGIFQSQIARRLAAVAAVLLLAIGITVLVHEIPSARPLTAWRLSMPGEASKPVRAGQLVEIKQNSEGTLRSDFVGEVDIDPGSRLRILEEKGDRRGLALERGTIHALIWAPPAKFVVDTPNAKAVDLGCKYTLHVEPGGNGLLTVEIGWVAFQWRGVESFIPSGAACATRPGQGPATPYFLDAPAEFKNALTEFDQYGGRWALQKVLVTARKQDGLTLWHLLQRTRADERGEVFDRFAELISVPSSVTRAAVVRGDPQSFDATWNALDLGSTNWWREWKRSW